MATAKKAKKKQKYYAVTGGSDELLAALENWGAGAHEGAPLFFYSDGSEGDALYILSEQKLSTAEQKEICKVVRSETNVEDHPEDAA